MATFAQIRDVTDRRVENLFAPEAIYDGSRQMWRCVDCGRIRQWGHHKPESFEQPLLNCRDCEIETRHSFLRVIG
jgi:hypothetical protein